MHEVCAARFDQVTTRLEKHQPSCIFSQQLSYHTGCLHLFECGTRENHLVRDQTCPPWKYVIWQRRDHTTLSTNSSRLISAPPLLIWLFIKMKCLRQHIHHIVHIF